MADFSSSNNGGGLLQLEAKRRTDSSWHPCRISLRPTRGLAVKFEDQDSEDIIFNAKDALASLRVRSAPLQGDDCSHIEEGKNVVAAYEKNDETLFFDAIVKKVIRVRHSKRAVCRCSFMIKWLFPNPKDEVSTIPSGSIMKLASESIKAHPVVASFLDSVESTSLLDTGFDEIDSEININGLLGVHLKEIGSLVGVSNIGHVEDALLRGICFGVRETRIESPTSERASKSQAEVNCRSKELRSSTKKQVKTKDESPMTNSPPFLKARLNPLAARAALASLVSGTPQMNGTTTSPVHNSHHLQDSDDSDNANLVDDVKSPRKTEERGQRSNGNKLSSKKSSKKLVLESEESIQPVTAGRVTRSAIKQENKTSNGEVKTTLLSEDVTPVRATRSGAHKRNSNKADSVEEPYGGKTRSEKITNSTVKEIEEDNSQIYSDNTLLAEDVTPARATRSGGHKRNSNKAESVEEPFFGKTRSANRTSSTVKEIEEDNSQSYSDKTLLAEVVTPARATRSGAHKRNANKAPDSVEESFGGKTRSASRMNSTVKEREPEMPKIEDNSQTYSDKTLLSEDVTPARATRSGAHKRNANKVDSVEEPFGGKTVSASRINSTVKDMEEDNSQIYSDKTSLAEDVTPARATRSGAHKRNTNKADSVEQPFGGKTRSASRTNSTVKETEPEMPKIEVNNQTLSDKTLLSEDATPSPTTLTRTTRVTRSSARKQTGGSDSIVKQSLCDRSGIESARSDDGMSDFEAAEKKRDPPMTEVKMKSAERNKKQKVSNDVDRKQKTTVDVKSRSLKRTRYQDQLSQS